MKSGYPCLTKTFDFGLLNKLNWINSHITINHVLEDTVDKIMHPKSNLANNNMAFYELQAQSLFSTLFLAVFSW